MLIRCQTSIPIEKQIKNFNTLSNLISNRETNKTSIPCQTSFQTEKQTKLQYPVKPHSKQRNKKKSSIHCQTSFQTEKRTNLQYAVKLCFPQRSKMQTFAELIDEWKNFRSVTAKSINANAGFQLANYAISGTFSKEYAQVKGQQIEDKSATIRIQLRYHRSEAGRKTWD